MSVSEAPTFGAHPITVSSVYNFTPEALEEVAEYLEQRGLRTPVGQLVGFSQFVG